jgi:hypothetical protein
MQCLCTVATDREEAIDVAARLHEAPEELKELARLPGDVHHGDTEDTEIEKAAP